MKKILFVVYILIFFCVVSLNVQAESQSSYGLGTRHKVENYLGSYYFTVDNILLLENNTREKDKNPYIAVLGVMENVDFGSSVNDYAIAAQVYESMNVVDQDGFSLRSFYGPSYDKYEGVDHVDKGAKKRISLSYYYYEDISEVSVQFADGSLVTVPLSVNSGSKENTTGNNQTDTKKENKNNTELEEKISKLEALVEDLTEKTATIETAMAEIEARISDLDKKIGNSTVASAGDKEEQLSGQNSELTISSPSEAGLLSTMYDESYSVLTGILAENETATPEPTETPKPAE